MTGANKELARVLDSLMSREPERLEVVAETGDGWYHDLWPEEPDSWWWFYGVSSASKEQPRLSAVKVWGTGSGPAYVCDGQFLYRSGGTGWWKRIPTPDLPVEGLNGGIDGK